MCTTLVRSGEGGWRRSTGSVVIRCAVYVSRPQSSRHNVAARETKKNDTSVQTGAHRAMLQVSGVGVLCVEISGEFSWEGGVGWEGRSGVIDVIVM